LAKPPKGAVDTDNLKVIAYDAVWAGKTASGSWTNLESDRAA